MHCAYNPISGKAYIGTREDIANQIYEWGFQPYSNVLWSKHPGYVKNTYHSYSQQWTSDEKRKDALRFLYDRLPRFGYLLFENKD